jgi:hypothetical protein
MAYCFVEFLCFSDEAWTDIMVERWGSVGTGAVRESGWIGSELVDQN